MSELNLYQRLGGKNVVDTLTERFYRKLLDDYRVSRFFNDTEQNKQVETLKALVTAIFNNHEVKALLSDFFMSAFARFKDKERLPESGFAYFGYIIGQNHPSQKWLCDSHSHLLKFMPEDSHYDAVMEHLAVCLKELNLDNALDNALVTEVLTLAESGRNRLLGK